MRDSIIFQLIEREGYYQGVTNKTKNVYLCRYGTDRWLRRFNIKATRFRVTLRKKPFQNSMRVYVAEWARKLRLSDLDTDIWMGAIHWIRHHFPEVEKRSIVLYMSIEPLN